MLASALRDSRRLRLAEAQQIESIIRNLGRDPDAPPFTTCDWVCATRKECESWRTLP